MSVRQWFAATDRNGDNLASKKSYQKKKKRIGRMNPVVYFFVYLFLRPLYRIRFGMRIDKKGLRGIREGKGALVLAPHTSTKDHWLIAMALFPHRPTFVVSEHFMANPSLRPLMHMAHVITKKMFCADPPAVLNMMRAAKEGNIIVLFPEGRLTCNARTGFITAGTAQLAKKLGLDVYTVTANGASLTFPKWAWAPRCGRILVKSEKLLTGADMQSMTAEEIEARMQAAIDHDDAASMRGILYRSEAPAEGLHGILYRCPKCKKEFEMTSAGKYISCSCGFSAELTEDYRLIGAPFSTILEWYDWQASLLDLDTPMEADATIGAVDGEGNMDRQAGHARIRLDRESFSFVGEVFGEPVSFVRTTESITAFPITVHEEFDIYQNNRLYYMYPEPYHGAAVKWVSYLDRVTAEHRSAVTSDTRVIEPS